MKPHSCEAKGIQGATGDHLLLRGDQLAQKLVAVALRLETLRYSSSRIAIRWHRAETQMMTTQIFIPRGRIYCGLSTSFKNSSMVIMQPASGKWPSLASTHEVAHQSRSQQRHGKPNVTSATVAKNCRSVGLVDCCRHIISGWWLGHPSEK